MSDSVIQCQGLFKTFTEGPQDVEVLKGIDISIAKGERVAIVGASGSGKSTLLHLLGGLDVPTAGDIQVMGQTMSAMGEVAGLCLPVSPSIGRVHRAGKRQHAIINSRYANGTSPPESQFHAGTGWAWAAFNT